MKRRLGLSTQAWETRQPFRITGRTWHAFESVVCQIEQDGLIGSGAGHAVYYCGESPETMRAQINGIAENIEAGLDREALQSLLPPGGARNAIDCALWDLEAKISGRSVWAMNDLAPQSVATVVTIGIQDTPEQMAEQAAGIQAELLKIKLDGNLPIERIQAIRAVKPKAHLIVDANQAWTFTQLQEVAPAFATLGVAMVEQPLPRGGDAELEGYRSPVPLCADESCLHRGELAQAARRYQMINIKLDKAGGLTEAMLLASAARELGMELMVGCMGGNSLAMAPHHVVAQLCRYVDIDGPLLSKYDCLPGLDYRADGVHVPTSQFWGLPE